IGKWIGYIDKYLLFPWILRRKLKQLPERSVVHIIDHSNAPYAKYLPQTPHLITCHDLMAIRSALGEIPQHEPKWTGKQQQAMILRGLKRSQHIVSVSKATRQDVARLVGDQAAHQHLIANALNDEFIQMAQHPRSKTTAAPPYVMHIGGEKWYKNRKAVLQIFAILAAKLPELELVIVGPEFSDAALSATGCTTLKERIRYQSGISDAELCSLYQGAEILLFPSYLEGFGWPILEAQACGCTVATYQVEPMSSLNAIPDLAAGDGTDADILASAAANYMQLDSEDKAKLQEKARAFAAQFSNAASAQAYHKLYQEVMDHALK
ncbi:MAG: glycosyltransferase family 4 protein, partial [Coraliomargarita sp.]